MKNYQFSVVEDHHAELPVVPTIVGAAITFPYGSGEFTATVDRLSKGVAATEVYLYTEMKYGSRQHLELTITADRARELEDFFRLVRTHLDAGGM